jgi:hypothetical protein
MGVRFIALEPTLSADRDVAEGSVADIAASRWQGGAILSSIASISRLRPRKIQGSKNPDFGADPR